MTESLGNLGTILRDWAKENVERGIFEVVKSYEK